MKKYQKGGFLFELVMAAIAVMGFVGWLKNIAALVALPIGQWGLFEVVRIFGVPIFPIGCFAGFF